MTENQPESQKKTAKKLTDLKPVNATGKTIDNLKGGAGGGTTVIPKPPHR